MHNGVNKAIASLLICMGLMMTSVVATPEMRYNLTPKSGSIGDEFVFELAITTNINETALPTPFPQKEWGKFTIKKIGTKQTKASDKVGASYRFVTSIFELGDQLWPTMSILVSEKNVTSSVIIPAQKIEIHSIVTDKNGKLRPQRSAQKIKLNLWYYLLLFFGVVGVVIAIALGIWLWRKRKKTAAEITKRPQDERDPTTFITQEIALLYAKKMIEKGEGKRHYLEVTDLLKQYFSKRFAQHYSELTTSEVLYQLSSYIDEQTLKRIKNLLDYCDLVKFAKWRPDDTQHEQAYNRIIDIITRTSPKSDFSLNQSDLGGTKS